jgi:hypothetical protein
MEVIRTLYANTSFGTLFPFAHTPPRTLFHLPESIFATLHCIYGGLLASQYLRREGGPDKLISLRLALFLNVRKTFHYLSGWLADNFLTVGLEVWATTPLAQQLAFVLVCRMPSKME